MKLLGRQAFFLAALYLGAGICLAAEERMLELVALSHSGTAPGTTGTFTDFSTPVISHDGTIAYIGTGDDLGIGDLGGVWVHPKDGNATPVALAGADTPWPFSEQNPDVHAQYTIPDFFFLGTGNRLIVRASRGYVFSDLTGAPVEYIGPPLTQGSGGFDRFNTDPLFASDSSPFTMFVQGAAEGEFGFDDLFVYRNGTLDTLAKGASPSGVSTGIPLANLGAFRSMVATSGGNLVVHASLDPLNPAWSFFNGTALYSHTASGSRLIVESDVPLGDSIGSGNYVLLMNPNGLPERPSVSAARNVVFRMDRLSDFNTVILESSLDSGELKLVAKEGQPILDQRGELTSFAVLGDRPVVNRAGDIYFRAAESGFVEGLWRTRLGQFERLMKAGDVAPGTGNAEFEGPGSWVVNAQGRVAMLTTLKLGAVPLVTPDNNLGLWLQDDKGNWGLVARTGTQLLIDDSDYGTIQSIAFETNGQEGTGNDEGIMSGLSDEGDLVFLVELSGGLVEGQKAIVRSRVLQGGPSGDNYFWTGAAGNNQWHGKNGDTSNWEDNHKINWPDPPGTRGKEIVKVDPAAAIVLDSKQADIARIDSKGSLEVRQDLFLEEDSTIENLKVTNGADVWTSGILALKGTKNELSGGNILAGNKKANVQVFSGALLSINGSAGSDIMITAGLLNHGTVNQAANLKLTYTSGLTNFGSYSLTSNAAISGGGFTLESNADLIRQAGGQSEIEYTKLRGGTVTVKESGALTLTSMDLAKQTTINIEKGGQLVLGPADLDASFSVDADQQTFSGEGDLIVRNSQVVLKGRILTLDVQNMTFNNVRLANKAWDDVNLSDRSILHLSTDEKFIETPVLRFKPTGTNVTTLEGLVIENYRAAAVVEGIAILDDKSFFLNYPRGILQLRNATLKASLGGLLDRTVANAGGRIVMEGTSSVQKPVKLQQAGTLRVLALSRASIDYLDDLSHNTLYRGIWEVDEGALLTVNNGDIIKGIGPGASVSLNGSAVFNNLPTFLLDGFHLDGVLELHDGANANVAGTMRIGPTGKLILDTSKLVVGLSLVLEPHAQLNGKLFVEGTVVNGGRVRLSSSPAKQSIGKLNVEGTVVNASRVRPASSPGLAVITGGYEQQATGALETELAGYQSGTDYDVLQISGEAALDGGLEVVLLDDFVPVPGDRFEVLTAGSLTGAFNSITMKPIRNDLEFVVEYSDTTVTVEAVPVQQSYESWVTQVFAIEDQANEAVSGRLANPDLDEWPNFLEYLFDSDPLNAAARVEPVAVERNPAGEISLTFPWRAGLSDGRFELERSSDLQIWATTTDYEASLETTATGARVHLDLPPPKLPEDVASFFRVLFILD